MYSLREGRQTTYSARLKDGKPCLPGHRHCGASRMDLLMPLVDNPQRKGQLNCPTCARRKAIQRYACTGHVAFDVTTLKLPIESHNTHPREVIKLQRIGFHAYSVVELTCLQRPGGHLRLNAEECRQRIVEGRSRKRPLGPANKYKKTEHTCSDNFEDNDEGNIYPKDIIPQPLAIPSTSSVMQKQSRG